MIQALPELPGPHKPASLHAGATNVAEPASKQASVIAEQAAAFTKDFRANFEKELEKILSETQKKPPPKK